MSSAATAPIRYRSAGFELDLAAHCLRKGTSRIKLQPKPFEVLVALLERPGELITREELHARLWPGGTFVDFDQGLNVAIKKLRDAICDSADHPRYIETASGRGYRWMAEVQTVANGNGNGASFSGVLGEAPQSFTPNAAEQASSPPAVLSGEATAAEIGGKARRALTIWSLTSAAVILVLFTGLLLWKRSHAAPPASSPVLLLIANFENRTGESVLDDTLGYGLERELSNSQFVKVASHQRIEDALRLMKKRTDTRLEPDVAREVCLRDGGIPVFATGRIEKLGGNYVVSAELRVAATNTLVAGFSDEEKMQSHLAAAVRRISNQVSEKLAEQPSPIQPSNDQFEKVTTSSLRALQLYTRADHTMRSGPEGNHQAIALLEEALKEDPDFVSAHNLLGWTYWNDGNLTGARAHFNRAYALADTTPNRERLFIQASYYQMVLQDYDKSDDTYRTLLRLYPDHYWANNNAGDEDYVIRAAKLRPNDPQQNMMAARWLIGRALSAPDSQRNGVFLDPTELRPAEFYVERVRSLIKVGGAGISDSDRGDFDILLLQNHLLTGDIAATHDDLVRLDQRALPAPLSLYFMALGQLHEASRRMGEEGSKTPDFRRVAFFYFLGDTRSTKRLLQAWPKWDGQGAGIAGVLMLRLGMVVEADRVYRKLVSEEQAKTSSAMEIKILEGAIKLKKGQIDDGIAILERRLPQYQGATITCPAYELLADSYRQRGDLADAARTLQEDALVRPSELPSLFLRQRIQLQLADVYREMGRTANAEKVEADLRKELMFADPDHPILVALKKRERAQNTIARK
jgi:DNA-binding winged helix-turn-helix (wHTH) protein/tetratricopeptide (TPR) repeat protein